MYGFVQLLPQCTQALCMHMYVFFLVQVFRAHFMASPAKTMQLCILICELS